MDWSGCSSSLIKVVVDALKVSGLYLKGPHSAAVAAHVTCRPKPHHHRNKYQGGFMMTRWAFWQFHFSLMIIRKADVRVECSPGESVREPNWIKRRDETRGGM